MKLIQRTGRRSRALPLKWFHLTDRARFALDARFTPADASLSIEDRSGRPGIYIAPGVEPWINGYGYWRPFVVEFRVDPSVVADPGVHGRWGNELFVPAAAFDKLVLQRVIPLDAYARERFGEHGWIEGRLGREFDTGRAIPQRGWDEPWTIPFPDYRYSGPDVRDLPIADVRRLRRDLRVALQPAAKSGRAAQRWGDQQEIRRDDLEVVYSLVPLETAFADALDTFGYMRRLRDGNWTVGGGRTFDLAQAVAAQGITAADLQAHGLFLHSIEVAAARRRRGWARRFVAAAERWAVAQGATWGVLAAVNSVPFWGRLGWTALPETFYSAPEGQSAVMVKRLAPPPRGRGAARGRRRMTPGEQGWRREQALLRAARLRAVQRVRRRHPELPAPVELLDVGMQGGWVFSTTDPDTVVRVGARFWGSRDELEREELFLDPDFAPGVVQVRFLAASKKYVVSWKERVDLNVEGFLRRTYPETQALGVAHALLGLCDLGVSVRGLLGLWEIREARLRVLARCAATQGLARAIRAGLPTGDLDLNANLGVTRDGRVVAFDL